ncbi:ATP-binding protein [uncultured Acetobacteroides sp.]|uniref:sensor histidine kinase n=1 Tax=uncultured Acetobacteroides sp. TaxID=1760811 RepID=UPI0029F540ED|nr:ATP-binding protein [uncultured Acetobacteroides sp.]
MGYSRRYNWQVLAHVGGVVAAAAAVGASFGLRWSLPAGVVCVLLLLWSVVRLYRFLGMIHEQVFYFVRAVENDDTSILFPSKVGNVTLDKLYDALNRLNRHLHQVKVDGQLQEKYFGHILSQVDVGVILFRRDGVVREANAAALRLFKLPVLTHLRQLDRVCDGLTQQLMQQPDVGKRLLSIPIAESVVQVVAHSSAVDLQGESFVLMTLQDIRGELERKEIDAWAKLIRVLNHEITNSLTPVASLSESLLSLWNQELVSPDSQLVDSTLRGLSVIEERSRSLVSFVNSYRMLTKLPELHLSAVAVGDFMDRISILASQFRSNRISILVDPPATPFVFMVDEAMLIQVMLNLVKNGVEAIDGVGAVKIGASLHNDRVCLSVEDSGYGIPHEIADEVFIPFFTTKAQGSGIGLSHSQQIVRAHGGNISFTSMPGCTRFVVEL